MVRPYSSEQYKAVLSLIPPPSRVALTGSIAELRRVSVMFITVDLPAGLLAGWVVRTSTRRPTLNVLLLLRASIKRTLRPP